jgi:hypothetical protein
MSRPGVDSHSKGAACMFPVLKLRSMLYAYMPRFAAHAGVQRAGDISSECMLRMGRSMKRTVCGTTSRMLLAAWDSREQTSRQADEILQGWRSMPSNRDRHRTSPA